MWWKNSTTYFFRTFNFKQHLNSANEKHISAETEDKNVFFGKEDLFKFNQTSTIKIDASANFEKLQQELTNQGEGMKR